MITQEFVKNCFNYSDGFLYWKVKKMNIQVGQRAGTHKAKSNKYDQIKIDGVRYQTHVLIFLYHKGYIPIGIDHIDTDTFNNKIENFRECTDSQNAMNRKNMSDSISKYKGVCFCTLNKKFVARILVNKKRKFLGYFIDEIDAAIVYNQAAKIHFGEFAKLNEIPC